LLVYKTAFERDYRALRQSKMSCPWGAGSPVPSLGVRHRLFELRRPIGEKAGSRMPMQNTYGNQRLLSCSEAAERLNLPRRTVQDLITRNELPAFRFGRKWRIPEAALEAYIATAIERARSLRFKQL
jgi:excisionase family DNA binding protein